MSFCSKGARGYQQDPRGGQQVASWSPLAFLKPLSFFPPSLNVSAEAAFLEGHSGGRRVREYGRQDPAAGAELSKLLLILPGLSSLLVGACGCLLGTAVDRVKWTQAMDSRLLVEDHSQPQDRHCVP